VVFREVDVVEVREVLRGWLDGVGLRTVAARAGVDRKTARRYVQAAQEAGLTRDCGRCRPVPIRWPVSSARWLHGRRTPGHRERPDLSSAARSHLVALLDGG
jgi:hypothetical protein